MNAPLPRKTPQPHTPGRAEQERAWIAGVRAGDAASFEGLFRAYHQPLCGFAWRYVGSADIAEEIVQEVLLRVWQHRETWDVSVSAKTWLYSAVRNAAMSWLRHERVVQRRDAETISIFDRAPREADRELTDAETAAAVQAAIARLPERCRLVFTMHREQELTYGEIAVVLEISPKTVDTQMGRALKALRKHLRAHWR